MTRRKLAISCTEQAWARLQARARTQGKSASRYAVERALTAHPLPRAPAEDAEALVLSAEEQRALVETIGRIYADLQEGGPTANTLEQLSRRMGVLVTMAMEEWVRAGRGERLLAIAEELLGEERMPAIREWVRGRERNLRT